MLDKVSPRIKENCLKTKKEKFLFSVDQMKFSGYTLTSHSIVPDEKKMEAIKNITSPTNASQVNSFLGIVDYCHKFIANFSVITEPLRGLKKESEIHMGEEQREAFQKLKQKLISAGVMCYYNPNAAITL